MRIILARRKAITDFITTLETDDREHGGAFFGDAATGAIRHFVAAPTDAMRTQVRITFDGEHFDQALRELRRADPAAEFLGYGHGHMHLRDLSPGDHQQINSLHASGRIPPRGLLIVLGVRAPGARTIVRAWWTTAPNVLEDVAIAEVDDVDLVQEPTKPSPVVRAPVLGTDAGAQRLALELGALEARGLTIEAEVVERAVAISLTHPDREGTVVAEVPGEGWERIPRVSLGAKSATSRVPVIGALAPLAAVWNSAFSLCDLVDFLNERRVWRRKPSSPPLTTERQECAS